jgi:uncharacterized membrane protein
MKFTDFYVSNWIRAAKVSLGLLACALRLVYSGRVDLFDWIGL